MSRIVFQSALATFKRTKQALASFLTVWSAISLAQWLTFLSMATSTAPCHSALVHHVKMFPIPFGAPRGGSEHFSLLDWKKSVFSPSLVSNFSSFCLHPDFQYLNQGFMNSSHWNNYDKTVLLVVEKYLRGPTNIKIWTLKTDGA